MSLRVYVVEDSPLVFERLQEAISENGASVVGYAEDATTAIAEIAALRPDAIIVELLQHVEPRSLLQGDVADDRVGPQRCNLGDCGSRVFGVSHDARAVLFDRLLEALEHERRVFNDVYA